MGNRPPIEAIEVRRFRGIREGAVDGFGQVTILVGRNGAGKFSILEAIYLASVYVSRINPTKTWTSPDLLYILLYYYIVKTVR